MNTGNNIQGLITMFGNIIGSLIPILIAVALVGFFYGLVMYAWSGGEFKEKGKNVMIAGLVALFVMVSVWGIIRLAQSTLLPGADNTNAIPAPKLPK